jgi:hypothetical protein
MTKQEGLSAVKGMIIAASIVCISGSGYLVWHHKQAPKHASAAAATAKIIYSSRSVTSFAGLISELQVLDETDVTASSTDSSQLGNQVSAF